MENKIELLSQTTDMMCSDKYDERFKAEYYQLKIRYKSLCEIINKYYNGTLAFKLSCNINILTKQVIIMQDYINILQLRAGVEGIELDK